MAPAELYARARSLFPYFSTATNPAFMENAGGSQVGCGGPGWAQAGALAWRPWPPGPPQLPRCGPAQVPACVIEAISNYMARSAALPAALERRRCPPVTGDTAHAAGACPSTCTCPACATSTTPPPGPASPGRTCSWAPATSRATSPRRRCRARTRWSGCAPPADGSAQPPSHPTPCTQPPASSPRPARPCRRC
jgi:hypothetical protein